MATERLACALEVKGLDADGEGSFEGYGSVFHVTDKGRDVVLPGAFTRTLQESATKQRMPAMLWQHDYMQPIGRWVSMAQDDRGLRVKGLLATNTRAGRDAYELMKMGALDGLSIGYSTKRGTWDDVEKRRKLLDLDLHEVSPVVFPMNEDSRVSVVKADGSINIRDIEAALRDAGLSLKQAKALLADGYRALRDDVADDEELDLARALRRAAKELRV